MQVEPLTVPALEVPSPQSIVQVWLSLLPGSEMVALSATGVPGSTSVLAAGRSILTVGATLATTSRAPPETAGATPSDAVSVNV